MLSVVVLNEGYGVDGVRSHEGVFEDFGQVSGFGFGGVTEIVDEGAVEEGKLSGDSRQICLHCCKVIFPEFT